MESCVVVFFSLFYFTEKVQGPGAFKSRETFEKEEAFSLGSRWLLPSLSPMARIFFFATEIIALHS